MVAANILTEHRSATNHFTPDSRRLHVFTVRGSGQSLRWPHACFVVSMLAELRGLSTSACNLEQGRAVLWPIASRHLEWLSCYVLEYLYLRDLSSSSPWSNGRYVRVLGQHWQHIRRNRGQLYEGSNGQAIVSHPNRFIIYCAAGPLYWTTFCP